jgi:uncharacterized protein YbjT (DUF2867 family)
MKVLVTGGTGVVGEAVVRALHGRGHTVRVLTRHAGRDEKWWPEDVEGWAGDVSNDHSIQGAAAGCEAVVHIAGIVEEQQPSITFQSVNIDGTRYVVMEAERAGVRKLIYVSSLGAERGGSDSHKSKYVAEDVVRTFTRDWLVLRPGAVYGPGDDHLSVLLQMMRTLPVIPTIGDGNQKFQPIWHEDFAEAVARAVERDVRCQVLDIAGTELTSQNDLVARLRAIPGRSVVQAPLPEVFASWGMRALGAVGMDVNFNEAQMAMLTEGNVIPAGRPNGLTDVLGVAPTRLEDGLRRLVNEQPVQSPGDGVGPLSRKRYWVDISGSKLDADGLFEYVRTHLAELMPPLVEMKAEPHATTCIEEGETLTLGIPVRGNIQVRVVEVADRRITLLTVAGHPIAGAVRFMVGQRPDGIRFEIEVYDRASSTFDELLMRTAGEWLQRVTWTGLAHRVANAAGGTSTDVRVMQEQLDAHEMSVVDEWAKTLSAQLSRKATSAGRD